MSLWQQITNVAKKQMERLLGRDIKSQNNSPRTVDLLAHERLIYSVEKHRVLFVFFGLSAVAVVIFLIMLCVVDFSDGIETDTSYRKNLRALMGNEPRYGFHYTKLKCTKDTGKTIFKI